MYLFSGIVKWLRFRSFATPLNKSIGFYLHIPAGAGYGRRLLLSSTTMKFRQYPLLPALAAVVFLAGCGDDDNKPADFDRQGLLTHYAQNLIVPAYEALSAEAEVLKQKVDAFTVTPSAVALTEARQAWIRAYTTWQGANGYNFGPAGESGIRKGLIEEVGTFPASESKIEAAIAANDNSLNNFDRDARGFLAIEYLLFGLNGASAEEVAAAFAGSGPRRDYLNALTANLTSRIDAVVAEWGAYGAEFTANKGTDAGSSISVLYNEFVKSFESCKNFKVGLPAGKRPGQTQPEPQLVEAYYSGVSLATLKAHLKAVEAIYYGQGANGVAGLSFKDYLNSVAGGPELVALTEAQWQNVMAALDAVPADRPLAALAAEDNPQLDALHTELQKHTRFFKSDMSSLLGIAITFSSGDGD